jgi:predicted nucleic acid-binding protein
MAQRIDFIADTSAIIGVLRRQTDVEEKIRGKKFAITFVTLAELSLGVLKAARPDRGVGDRSQVANPREG